MHHLLRTALLTLGVAAAAALPASGTEVKLGPKGFDITGNDLGPVTVTYPKLSGAKPAGPADVKIAGARATLTYADGTLATVDVTGPGVFQFHFMSLPDNVKKLRLDAALPGTLAGKASWSFDGKPAELLAETYGGKAFLHKADAKRFALKDASGNGFAVIMPFGFQQLQDNREWKTAEFAWFTMADMPRSGADEAYMEIKIADTPEGTPKATAAAPPPPEIAAPAAATAPERLAFSLTDKEILIDAGVAGKFGIKLPALTGLKPASPLEATLSADRKSMTLKYAGGATGKIALTSEQAVTFSLATLPAEAKKFRIEMMVPISYASGGKWSVAGGAPTPFPADKPEKAFLYQGHAQSFTVVHPSGAGFTLGGFEQGAFQQLQDNREWNWSIFGWWLETPLPAGNDAPVFTFTLAAPNGTAAVKIKPLIDRFGQHADVEFEGKIASDDDLKQDAQRDQEYYASLNPPAFDRFGGLPGSQEKLHLKKTGFFHIETTGKNQQVMVDPDGNLFFQLGLCALATNCDDYTTVKGRERIYEWLPKGPDAAAFKTAWRPNDSGVFSFYIANLIRKYGEPFDQGKFVARSVERARKWGYNSAGAFAGWGPEGTKAVNDASLPRVGFLPLGDSVAMSLPIPKVWDPFTDNIEAKMDAAFAKSVAPKADDPLIIGYFITNEPSIEDVPRVIPTLKGSKFGAKRRLIQLFQEKYPTIDAFNAAWDTKAASFDELKDTPLAITTKAASQDMQEYYRLFLEQRYGLINKYFRKHDPNHLLIGDRWMPGTANSEPLVRIAGKYLDVVSVNYYTNGIEKGFLERLHNWSGGKPMILSEFYYSCRDQGLSGGGTRVTDQHERGLAYRNYVEQSVSTGFVVGIQWFSHLDQAATGRFFEGFSGEAANIGVVNVADRPYKPFLAEAMKTNYSIYDVILGVRPPYAYDNPRFALKKGGSKKTVAVSHMTKPVVLDGRRDEWPPVPPTRIGPENLVIGRAAENFEATFRLAWDDQNLYVFAEIVDTTPMRNENKDDAIWGNDGIEVFIGYDNLSEGGTMQFCDRQILIRGGKTDATHAAAFFLNAPKPGSTAQTAVIPGVDGRSYTIEAAIPFSTLGFTPKPNQEVIFDLCVDDGDGGRRMLAWNGSARNSRNRGDWGRADFTP